MGRRRAGRTGSRLLLVAVVVQSVVLVPVAGRGQDLPQPPRQLESGPGGSAAPFAAVAARRVGEPPAGYWIFTPETSTGTDPAAPAAPWPLVVFFHGFAAIDPTTYRAWIDHVVMRGAVVVYPDYQALRLSDLDPRTYLPNAIAAIRSAVADLDAAGDRGSPLVDLERVVVVGHSAGGVLAVNVAAVAADLGLPVPDAVMPVLPGGCRGCALGTEGGPSGFGLPIARLERVAPETLLLMVVGEADGVVGRHAAEVIWGRLERIPDERRAYVLIRGDDHGRPALVADHFLAETESARGEEDALDWYGTWRLFDALTECAFTGEGCGVALGTDPAARAMGTWSDGVAVRELVVTDDPGAVRAG